ncbi:hypothetical protein QOZ80_3BG0265850 [Eleusine coracana subsp. coracana]|nr:hypothetical protein QOZ80_3BG0265850 [Eleusine coracana subsp. coracana]
MLNLRFGPAATDNTTLAIAADDLYFLGFKNRPERWHILRGGFKGLPDSVTLPMEENYQQLIGGHQKLATVPLGRKSAIKAAQDLASYDRSKTPNEIVKQAMTRFAIMISEAMRFTVIRNTFSGRWEEKTFITVDMAKYVVHWGKLSRLLVKWKRSPYKPWNDKDAEAVALVGINNANDAWLIIDFLLRPLDGEL